MMYYVSSELSHHGVKGMKWGVRKQRPSFGGRMHRLAAANYGLNERFYRRTGNKALASMNAQAKNQQLKKASLSDQRKQAKVNDKEHQARVAKAKRAAKIGAGVAIGVLAAYGGYKVYKLQGKAVDSLAQKSMNAGRQYLHAYYNGQQTRAEIMRYADKAKINGFKDSMQLHINNANNVERKANAYYDMAEKEIGRAARRDYSRKEVMQEMKRQIKKRKY